ncbi:MAG: DUF362 domain-containing protein [Candidatus Latescibacteria bacterium]|nr:DUF362 domain-containing protein [Candidatus Latescibacterota bacterium]NIO29024.1 DUF362 domain-containing protein [Candidatus Latescibacterota bacterium]NIO56649.1 DUF362 domain-containing protein [Candidatus Latescibacterota bacterium]NIT02232.1 DUF362 domain-containing protein [Candidatus Latescibacterota bacterium]NIT39117.1 DUF362 domain-containing protein [Candidatus Latescibacterota bacterium]
MKRRTFLKTFSAGLIGSTILDPADLLALASEPESSPLISVAKGTDPALITMEAVNALGGMSAFVSKGDIVLIKPNIGWDRTPEQAANTNPTVVATLIELAYKAGAKKVKLFDNTCNSARRCYKKSGIAEAARESGADVSFVDDKKFMKVKINGEKLKEWPVHKEALEADKIINVPIAKHHTLARLTLSMKNLMGIIGGRRNLLHQKIDTNVVDLAAFFKPTLVVLDAVRILTANGPQGGNLKDVTIMNTVAASCDQVAIDSYGATLFGMTGDSLPHVREAHTRGLGEKDLSKVRIVERTV